MGEQAILAFARKIQAAELRAVFKLWSICRGARIFPSWPQLEAQLPVLTSERIWAFNYDRRSGDFIARFARNTPIIGFGKSFRGTNLKDLHPPDIYPQAHANLLRVTIEPALCRLSGRIMKVDDRLVEGERIFMPIGSDESRAEGVFGASAFDFPFTKTPAHLELIHDIEDWCSLA